MSKLKEKLAKKLSVALGRNVDAEEIDFHKNGRRYDVVKWSIFGYECFSSGADSAKDDIKLEIADDTAGYGVYEIYAVDI